MSIRTLLSDGGERLIGVLMSTPADDKEGHARINAFVQGLRELGWIDGHNVRIDTRWAAGDADRGREYATELVTLMPDVILASGGSVVGPLLQATRTVPIVFTQTPDPVGAGLSITLRARAAMLPDFQFLTTALAGNGWNCSSRSHRA